MQLAHIILGYFILVNFAGVVITMIDKQRAKRGAWRVPEKSLFACCFAGGCPGVYVTMRAIRHKTLHKRFMWGIPAIFTLQVVVILVVYYFFRSV